MNAIAGAFERYFYGSHASVRSYLLTKVFLVLLSFDAFTLMIGHAGRYGAGGFNVAHFDWLDALLPAVSPGLYLGVLLLSGLLALTLALLGTHPLPMLALFVLYTFAWSMSMLDSYQHHYFVSLILLCMVFFPRVGARDLLDHGPIDRARSVGFGYALLGALMAIVYVYTAIAKMEGNWIDGHTIQAITSAKQGFGGLLSYAQRFGVSEADFWSAVATAVIPQELAMGVCYLFAVKQDAVKSLWMRLLMGAGFALVLVLHVGAEHMGLEIGWFSYYMLTLGACMLLPARLVAWLSKLIALPSRAVESAMARWERQEESPQVLLLLSLGAAAVVVGCGALINLPGALAACVTAAIALLVVCHASSQRPHWPDPRRSATASAAAAFVMWAAIAHSDVRWDFYRYLGGDLSRRGQLQAAIEAYEIGERYAPAGESRRDKIERLRRDLRRR